ncbi:MAG: NUDIX domain-containing protein [Rikenellaceae bacterium]
MHYNIYFTDHRVSFAPKAIESSDYTITRSSTPSREEIVQLLEYHNAISIITPEPYQTLMDFAKDFKAVLAAGGLVCNEQGRFLMILRNGRWDLPKGHWEQGESIEDCALREVEEETGADLLTISKPICITRHTYTVKGEWELKSTHWFSMRSTTHHSLSPQREEGIDSAGWFTAEECEQMIKGSYPTIREIFAALKQLS